MSVGAIASVGIVLLRPERIASLRVRFVVTHDVIHPVIHGACPWQSTRFYRGVITAGDFVGSWGLWSV